MSGKSGTTWVVVTPTRGSLNQFPRILRELTRCAWWRVLAVRHSGLEPERITAALTDRHEPCTSNGSRNVDMRVVRRVLFQVTGASLVVPFHGRTMSVLTSAQLDLP